MKQSWTLVSADGEDEFTVSESSRPNELVLRLSVSAPGGRDGESLKRITNLYITKAQWEELCELRYKVRFVEAQTISIPPLMPEIPPTMTAEQASVAFQEVPPPAEEIRPLTDDDAPF